ncbi:MAG TPA: sensor histidine kinase [Actinomycetota bacterium]
MKRREILLYAAAAAIGALDFAAPYLGRSTVSQASVLIGLNPPAIWPVAVHVLAREAFIVAGIAAISRPRNRTGYLMVAVGLAWMLADIGFIESSLTYTLSELVTAIQAIPLMHLALAFPTGELRSTWDRAIVRIVYLYMIPNAIGSLPFYDPHQNCPPCPSNLILIRNDPRLDSLVSTIIGSIGAVFAITVGIRLIFHWIQASPRGRRALAPVFVAAIPAVVVGVWDATSRVALPGASDLAFAAIPIGFLVGLLRARLDRYAVGDLVVELGSVRTGAELRDALARSMRDPSLELAYWLPDREIYVDTDGRAVELPPESSGRASAIVRTNGEPLAALVFDGSLREESELVSAVGAAAKLTLENEQLKAEIKAQLQEVRASRTRIVGAADEERRRLERDLHDGAQQRLVNLSLALRLAQDQAAHQSNGEVGTTLSEAANELRLALSELRELARGLHPTILTEEGLAPALESLAERSAIPATVEAAPLERLPAPVEATAYFVVSEALANCAKHSRASSARIRAERTNGELLVEVRDDGVGGADATEGSGLRGLADRVAALDGTFRVESPSGQGTRVIAEIPCG